MIPFASLRNPVLEYAEWSVKDYACAYRDGVYYLFFSAFFEDDGMVRCHVAEVCTADWREWSEPLLLFSGTDEGWRGMASPDVQEHEGVYYLTFNSWGDAPGKPNQLFYKTSPDLRRWRAGYAPLGANLTAGVRAIDAAIAHANDRCYLLWKQVQTTRLAAAPAAGADFRLVGEGYPNLKGQENYEFLMIARRWYLLTTHMPTHTPHLCALSGSGARDEGWLNWDSPRDLVAPREAFNSAHTANAAALYDWREREGYFYMFYAGNTENESFAGRGHNRLGLARSTDLSHWEAAGG